MNQYKVQIALDVTEESEALRIAGMVDNACRSGILDPQRVILEAGTPLVKLFGMSILGKIKLASPNTHLMADLKTADVGRLEASLAYSNLADSVSVLALAPRSTVKSVLLTGKEFNRGVVVDFIGVFDLKAKAEEVVRLVKEVDFPGENIVFEFHRGIDEEKGRSVEEFFKEVVETVQYLRRSFPEIKIAVAGGITPQLKQGLEQSVKPDIYVVGRYITSNPVIERLLDFF
ncbi:MAG: orotidine 5'-phosphate decarboxylase / HUMPS family protein [Infirmifilum sp.]